MKWCPKCQRIYEDEALNYCRVDGVNLWSTRDLTEDLSRKGPPSEEIVPSETESLTLHSANTTTLPETESLVAHSANTTVLDEAVTTSSLSVLPVPPTTIIGRDAEILEVKSLLRDKSVRLITLTGPGGTGKTRLSLQVGIELTSSFAEGVAFVPLAAVRDSNLVPSSMAQTLGVKEAAGIPVIDKLKDHLRNRETLLILDNFEQIVAAAPIVAELLSTCPQIKILVTSRESLHLRGEREFAVLPLALPDAKLKVSVDDLLDYSSVALFVDRAQAARSDFSLTIENGQSIAEICARLDGLPLAIELAAARIKLLSPQAMLARLENRLNLLRSGQRDLPARQQTMRDAIEWSYDLLEENEKTLFRHLSIFVGGFTLEAAESMCPTIDDIEIFDGVASLVDKSLLVRSDVSESEPRFTMLETIREYGIEALASSGELASLRQRHAEYYLMLAEQADPELWGPKGAELFKLIETELDNLRAALRWSHSDNGTPEATLRLAGALARFWWIRGYFSEGGQWLTKALSRSTEILTAARVKALLAASYLSYFQGDVLRSRTQAEQALTLSREIKEDKIISQSLNALGRHALDDMDYNSAFKMFEEGLHLAREVKDKMMIGISLNNLGELARIRGDHKWARSLYEESLTVHRELGIQGAVVTNLANLGHMALAQGDAEAASRFYIESLKLSYKLGDRRVVCLGLIGLAGAYWAEHEPDRAARLLGAAEAEREAINYKIELGDRAIYDQIIERVRLALGDNKFETMWSQGRSMRPGQAVIYGLEDMDES
jgi:predicted ATPase